MSQYKIIVEAIRPRKFEIVAKNGHEAKEIAMKMWWKNLEPVIGFFKKVK